MALSANLMYPPGHAMISGRAETRRKNNPRSIIRRKRFMESASRRKPADQPHAAALRAVMPELAEAEPMFDLIELLFFAYRDFVGDADRLLENYGFGRAHHRVLHFVSRRPGLTIAELLDILMITKQSLNRVLKELRDKGYVEV